MAIALLESIPPTMLTLDTAVSVQWLQAYNSTYNSTLALPLLSNLGSVFAVILSLFVFEHNATVVCMMTRCSVQT